NQTVVSTRRAWEEGDAVKYETEGGVKSLPKAAVLRIKHSPPVIVERAPVPPQVRSSSDPAPAPQPLAVPFPLSAENKDVSPEMTRGLQEGVESEPANRQVRADLVRALNAQAALLNLRGEYQDAIVALRRALAWEPKDLTSLINLAGLQYEVGDYRAAEE